MRIQCNQCRSRLWGTVLVTLVLCACFLGSCSTKMGYYCPKPAVAKGAAKGLVVSQPVRITNAQVSKEEHTLDFRSIIVNYQEFTQALVDAVKVELASHVAADTDTTAKMLHISVTNVEMPPPGATFSAYIHVDVKTGDGKLKRLLTNRSSYASPFNMGTVPTKPLNAAFRDMVEKILHDKAILAYLNE